ncbi:MAG: GNAT family N-acetyltransferase [Muribaculaceae bacterium]|nr:GNAT family N-acetyltransferase [Muribaculaceae bacterium]MDE7080383.1 GNAT family N-acetyltransferase [Muribaculaceae bacterium]
MSEIRLRRYTGADAGVWNAFVATSRNATFLFDRGYMDYHADRFADHSLIALKGDRPVAMLPANLREEDGGRCVLQSHGGLTYGGWILPTRHFDATDMLHVFDRLAHYCRAGGISSLDYRPLPYIYHRMPSQDDIYALFRQGARITETNLSCAIDLSAHPGLNTQQRRNLRRAEAASPRIDEPQDAAAFHALLSRCLAERHGAAPVHSAAELQMLHDRFPARIRLFTVSDADGIQAGACVYDTGTTAHTQYLCSTPEGRSRGLLTLLLSRLTDIFAHCRYLDFGTSNESHGLVLNEGLYRQKSSLGGSGVAYTRFTIDY